MKFIQLTDIDLINFVVIVFEKNLVKNKIINLPTPLSLEIVLKLNIMLNTFLQGLIHLDKPAHYPDEGQAGEYRKL